VAKKVVLISIGQPSINPRIVKEADAFFNAGYEVTVLYCFFIDWALEKDKLLLSKKKWRSFMIGGSPFQNKVIYHFTRLRFKIATLLCAKMGNKFLLAERSQARIYDEILSQAKKIKADWYIGHNLGALAVVVNAAKFNNAKAGFDFEDYHRGEGHDKNTLQRIIFLENKYVPSLFYYSTASELITSHTKIDHPHFNGRIITLLNCFPLLQQPSYLEKLQTDNTLQLFWFSQTIGTNRGLEILIDALKKLNNSAIHLTLAGRCDKNMLDYVNANAGSMASNIHYAGIFQPEDLPAFAAQFDVGMAIELSQPFNRNICLTNKVFTYLLAGSAIIFSETEMQSAFNLQYKAGESFALNNLAQLIEKIEGYLNHDKLNIQKNHNYLLAKIELNWENESKKLLEIIN
jgi:hypothetical protein